MIGAVERRLRAGVRSAQNRIDADLYHNHRIVFSVKFRLEFIECSV